MKKTRIKKSRDTVPLNNRQLLFDVGVVPFLHNCLDCIRSCGLPVLFAYKGTLVDFVTNFKYSHLNYAFCRHRDKKDY